MYAAATNMVAGPVSPNQPQRPPPRHDELLMLHGGVERHRQVSGDVRHDDVLVVLVCRTHTCSLRLPARPPGSRVRFDVMICSFGGCINIWIAPGRCACREEKSK